jgi:two-component system chemotaxis sensor kinase CheA
MSGHADPSAIFRQEAHELLVQLEEALLDLEQAPGDAELIATAFRALHTIKGSGSMFGFEAVAAFTHHVENAFERVRNGDLTVTSELVAIALTAKDHIRQSIEAPAEVAAGSEQKILVDLAALVGGSQTKIQASSNAAPGAPSQGLVVWRIRFNLQPDALAAGTNPLLLLQELADMGETVVTADTSKLPPLKEIDPEASYLGWEVVLTTDRPLSAIEDVFLFIRDDCGLQIDAVPIASESPTTSTPATESAPEGKTPPQPKPASAVVKVQAERIDGLMDQVGELVIAQSRLRQMAEGSNDLGLRAIAEEIERLSAGLRDTTMGIRMVPIGSLFNRFRRVVHDLSHDLGKEVRLVMSGEETELDKTMIENLGDPLVHLIRNSLDHGIDSDSERLAAGKPPEGTVSLAASHVGAQVLISVADDGRGLNAERIRAKAEEKALLAPGAEISDADLFKLIFHPGFSTAAQVTSVSGRGVGMDVVKRTIDGLRGVIDIASTPGQGTRITLRLPLTLAIIDGLLVRVGEGRYIIPLSAVEECVELSQEKEARATGHDFFDMRGMLVPYLRLRDLFAVQAGRAPYPKVVIVGSGEQRIGLVVDQILGSHQTVIKSLSKLEADAEMFSGATILGDGGVALILDIPHLVDFGQAREKLARAS